MSVQKGEDKTLEREGSRTGGVENLTRLNPGEFFNVFNGFKQDARSLYFNK